jgi:hypothetical protein
MSGSLTAYDDVSTAAALVIRNSLELKGIKIAGVARRLGP